MRAIDGDALIDKYGDWYTEEGTEDGYIGTIKGIVDSMPTIEPEIIYCKDCKKHNVNAGYKNDCCPLLDYRGISYGHEHDYQYCVYGVRKENETD